MIKVLATKETGILDLFRGFNGIFEHFLYNLHTNPNPSHNNNNM